ncbi:hypothetical protein B4168_1009 [Anoxybacillus flavithermus]|nr:hypothetical protein B4168_1009 [Anoxybacillus flavithermus]OAO87015.1 hypothetical protein GT23_2033 [Parageobacillus thermoglucosidasius]
MSNPLATPLLDGMKYYSLFSFLAFSIYFAMNRFYSFLRGG